MASAEQSSVLPTSDSQKSHRKLPSGLAALPCYCGFIRQCDVEAALLSSGDYAVWGDDSSYPYTYKLAVRCSPTEVRHVPLVSKTREASRIWAITADSKYHSRISQLVVALANEGGVKLGNDYILMKRAILDRPDRFFRESDIESSRFLDEGNFCAVSKATLKKKKGMHRHVAVKSFKGQFDPSYENVRERKQLLTEMAIMSSLDHVNVITYYGIVCDIPPIKIVMEYCPGGSLLKHLEALRDQIPIPERLVYCFEASRGMAHLEENHIIHRDLAARNCLISMHGCVKIADFGLSITETELQTESTDSKTRFPIRLMSPETLQKYPRYSNKSDVWAYGMLMWEIFSNGAKAWLDGVPKEIRKDIRKGIMPPIPRLAPKEVQEIIKQCWQLDPTRRPMFMNLVKQIHVLITPGGQYQPPLPHERTVAKIKGVIVDPHDDFNIQVAPPSRNTARRHREPAASSVTDDTNEEVQPGNAGSSPRPPNLFNKTLGSRAQRRQAESGRHSSRTRTKLHRPRRLTITSQQTTRHSAQRQPKTKSRDKKKRGRTTTTSRS